MITYFTVKDNTAPAIEVTLKRNNVAIDLTGAAITMAIQNKKTKVITNTGHQTCSVIDAPNGVISYVVEATDFPNPKVGYLAEIKIVYSSSRVERLYDLINVSIREKIH